MQHIPLYYITKFVFSNLDSFNTLPFINYILFALVFILTSVVMAIIIILFTQTPLRYCIGKWR